MAIVIIISLFIITSFCGVVVKTVIFAIAMMTNVSYTIAMMTNVSYYYYCSILDHHFSVIVIVVISY